ncbi:MAG: GAF domain-containing protein [Chloroflexota bacterium]|nr:GAF domain-containing protein [Chloroflexota bacterium]
MKIYPKILLITLPLIVLPALLVGLVAYQSSRSALQSVVQDVLGARLTRAVDICVENETVLREYGLENVPSNVTRAQSDAATAMLEIRFGETGYVFVVDSQGIIRAHPDANLVGSNVNAESWFQEIVNVGKGDTQFVWQEERRGAAFEYFEPWDWYIVSSGAESELGGAIGRLGGYTMLLLVVSLVIATATLLFLTRRLTAPIHALTAGTEKIRQGELETHIPVTSRDEIGVLADAFNQMTDQLRQLIGSLEQRVIERTRDLEQRSAYLEASAEVGRAASSILEIEELIRQVVELTRERFNLYYVGLFLVGEAGEWAVLRAGTGEAGRTMLARGHRIKIGEGMIGWSIANAQARVALEAGEDAVRLATAELPDTRSEAALPLRSRGRVIGALTVQHVQPGAFDQDTITVLQTMADQVAVAMDNARLFAASQEALQSERRAYGELSREVWAQMARARPDWGYLSNQRGVFPSTGDWQPEMAQATQTGQSVQMDGAGAPTLAIPIKVRDHVVGALRFHKHETGETWTTEETALLETLTDRLAEALESARLYQDTQRRAAREQLTGQVTARMRETLDVETVLETATDEIYRALGLEKIVVRLATEEANDESAFGDPTTAAQRGRIPQEDVV